MSQAARELVTRRIARRTLQFPNLELAALDTSGLDGRDAALAGAIDHAVARRWLTLATVLEHPLTRAWDCVEPNLQAVLLTGAAQLLFLDRVPEHAAINEAVALAKRLVRPKAGGLVNAVLRKVAGLRDTIVPAPDPERRDEIWLHDGRAWRLHEPIFHEDAMARWGQQTSHPLTLLAHWQAMLGAPATHALARHSLVHAPIIVANGAAGREDERETSAPEGASRETGDPSGPLVPHEEAGFSVYTGPREALPEILARAPGRRVQDPTAAAPVLATRSLSPGLIIDACAGKGTKTVQLAEVHPRARIIASDKDPHRLSVLRRTLEHVERVEVVEFAALRSFAGQADLLVLDVPCSNTGVLARRVEAKYRFSPDGLRKLVDLQRQIIADTLPLLGVANSGGGGEAGGAGGAGAGFVGHVLYTTCSVEPAENTEQARWLVQWHRMRIVQEHTELPRGLPGDAPTGYADGGYYALLNASER